MSKSLKIAIPSDDGLIVKKGLCSSRGYVVATIASGQIIRQEMRWNLLSELLTSSEGRYYNLHDCKLVIFNAISKKRHELLLSKDLQVLLTDKVSVNDAFADFLTTTAEYEYKKQIA